MKIASKIFWALMIVIAAVIMLIVVSLGCFYTIAFFLFGTIAKGIITAALTFCFTVASCITITTMKDIFSEK